MPLRDKRKDIPNDKDNTRNSVFRKYVYNWIKQDAIGDEILPQRIVIIDHPPDNGDQSGGETDQTGTDTTSDVTGSIPMMWVYDTTEFDALYYDKVTKTGPTRYNNIVLLKDDGDIKDSGVNPDDFDYELFDGGTF